MSLMTQAPKDLKNLFDYLEERAKKLNVKIEKLDTERDELAKKRKEMVSEKEDIQNCMDTVINVLLAKRFEDAEKAYCGRVRGKK
jgi:hypothetical protein